jgi:hypothetical protein
MPRFYFHLLNDVDAPDNEGLDLLDLAAARLHAGNQARFTAGEMVKLQGKIDLHYRIDIENHRGNVLDTVCFGDVVSVCDLR